MRIERKIDLHVHKMPLSILQTILSQANANWQDSIAIDALPSVPKSWGGGTLFVDGITCWSRGCTAMSDQGNKSRRKQRRLHLEDNLRALKEVESGCQP